MKRLPTAQLNYQIEQLEIDIGAFQRELEKDLYLLATYQVLTIGSGIGLIVTGILANHPNVSAMIALLSGLTGLIFLAIGAVCWLDKRQHVISKKKTITVKRQRVEDLQNHQKTFY